MTVCLIIHLFFKNCEREIVFVLICTLAKQFHVHKSYKTSESTLSCIGNSEGNINLSQFYLVVYRILCKKWALIYRVDCILLFALYTSSCYLLEQLPFSAVGIVK